jgi:hypothetical protein
MELWLHLCKQKEQVQLTRLIGGEHAGHGARRRQKADENGAAACRA